MVSEEQNSDVELASEVIPVPQVQPAIEAPGVLEVDNQENEDVSIKKPRHRKKALYAAIRKQMEFYFSDSNLTRDRFLATLVKRDPNVHLDTFLSFNKIRSLTTETKVIAKALKNSTILNVTEDGLKVYRTTPIVEKQNVDECTVYVQGLPSDADHEWLSSLFAEYGPVAYVSIPKFKHNHKIKGFAFIEFETPNGANKCLEAFRNKGCELPSQTQASEVLSITTFKEEEEQLKNLENKSKRKKSLKSDDLQDSEVSDPSKQKKKKYNDDDKDSSACPSDSNTESEEKRVKKRKGRHSIEGKTDSETESQKNVEVSKKQKKGKDSENPIEIENEESNTNEEETEDTTGKKKKKKRKLMDGTNDETNGETIEELIKKKKKKDSSDENVVDTENNEDASEKKKKKNSSEENDDTAGHEENSEKKNKRKVADEAEETNEEPTEKKKKSSDETDKPESKEDIDEVTNGVTSENKKKKRKRTKHGAYEKLEATDMGLQIMGKKDWKRLRNKYLELQRSKMKQLKQHLRKAQWNQWGDNRHKMETEQVGDEKKNPASNLEFVPGVIIKAELSEACVDPKGFKAGLRANTHIKYIDIKEGSNVAFIRCDSSDAATELATKSNEERCYKIVSGDEEKSYWDKIIKDREEKIGNKVRTKQRGRDKLLKKAEKVLGKHIKFDEEV